MMPLDPYYAAGLQQATPPAPLDHGVDTGAGMGLSDLGAGERLVVGGVPVGATATAPLQSGSMYRQRHTDGGGSTGADTLQQPRKRQRQQQYPLQPHHLQSRDWQQQYRGLPQYTGVTMLPQGPEVQAVGAVLNAPTLIGRPPSSGSLRVHAGSNPATQLGQLSAAVSAAATPCECIAAGSPECINVERCRSRYSRACVFGFPL